jgi:hypothetical protein
MWELLVLKVKTNLDISFSPKPLPKYHSIKYIQGE